jgi:hypothetical protein
MCPPGSKAHRHALVTALPITQCRDLLPGGHIVPPLQGVATWPNRTVVIRLLSPREPQQLVGYARRRGVV